MGSPYGHIREGFYPRFIPYIDDGDREASAYLGANLNLAGIPMLIPKLDLRGEMRRNSSDSLPKMGTLALS